MLYKSKLQIFVTDIFLCRSEEFETKYRNMISNEEDADEDFKADLKELKTPEQLKAERCIANILTTDVVGACYSFQ